MEPFDPVEIAKWCGGEWNRVPDPRIKGFCIDSRTVTLGNLFVALKAERDGHKFINQAVAGGAVGALVDHYEKSSDCPQLLAKDTLCAFQKIAQKHRSLFSQKVIGVTGSCGKTSTKEILRLLLTDSHCTDGNLNNHLGVPLTLTKINLDKHKYAVVEAGINMPGEMDVLAEMINPDVCVITSIGESHLEGLGTVNNVAAEKIKLWPRSNSGCLGIFPEELLKYEPFNNAFNESDRRCILVKKESSSVSEYNPNRVYYDVSTETNECGHSQDLIINRCGCPPLVSRIPHSSEGIIRNMVLACVVAWKLGITDEEICERLPQYRPSGLRGSCLVGRGCHYVLDCYNANPSSMLDSINFFLKKFNSVPRLLLLGGMNELGHSSKAIHRETGKSIRLKHRDHAVLLGEHAPEFADGMMESGAAEEQISILKDPENAKPLIEEFKGAVLLKGSRSYQLESLIPEWAVEEFEPMKIAC